VDLFAIAIILFILYTGHPPFNCANPQRDPHYQLLAQGKADLFWHQHSKSKPAGFFSEEFKDLITNMLQLNPNARLSLADCVGHAWMQGPIASAEQVRKEFAKRAEAIKKQKEEEAEQAAKQRAQVDPKRKAAVRAIKGEVENGPLDQFCAEDVLAQDTVLYSTYEPKDLLDMFQGELINKDIKHE
jgi:serine/threonine protein kinase